MDSMNYIRDMDFRKKALLLIVILSPFAAVGCKNDNLERSSDINPPYAQEQTIEKKTEASSIYGQSMQAHYDSCDNLMKQTWVFENSKDRILVNQAIECMKEYENRYSGQEGYKSFNAWKSTLEAKLQRL